MLPQTQYSRLLLPLSDLPSSICYRGLTCRPPRDTRTGSRTRDPGTRWWPGWAGPCRRGRTCPSGGRDLSHDLYISWHPWSLISWRIVLLIWYLLAIYILFLYLLNSNPFQAWWCQCCYVNIMRFWWASWQLSAPKYKNIYLREWGS